MNNEKKLYNIDKYIKRLAEPFFYGISLLIIAFVWCLLLKVWRADWNIPFDYGTKLGNDALGASTWIKSYLQNGFSWEQSDFSVPFSTDRKGEFGVDRMVLLLEILCSRLFSSYGGCLNALYLLSFLTAGFTALYSLRSMGFSRGSCLSGSLMYTFLQYHLMRGEMHLYLAFYYSIPLAVLVMLWLTDESLLTERFSQCVMGRIRRGHIMLGFFSWIIGLQQPYYAFFAAIGISYALLYSLCRKKSGKVLESVGSLLIIALTTLAGNLNALLNASDQAIQYLRRQRTVGSIEFYGLKLINLLLPVQNHRLPLLARLRQHYDVLVGAGENETGWVSLGFVLSICLCTALGTVLLRIRGDRRLHVCGNYILMLVLVATVGGGSSIIGLLFPLLRCYNRMVVLIAMFCVIVFAVLTERIKLFRRRIPSALQRGLLLLLTAFALWDQTSSANVSAYADTKEKYLRDEEFVQAIESLMPDDACIFELPALPTGVTAAYNLADYELYRPYLHAQSTRWLHMYSVGSRTDQWVTLLHGLPLRAVIDVIVCCDFQGIYLDSRGFSPEQWAETLAVMDTIESSAMICSADGNQIFYSLTDYAAALRKRLGEESMRQCADFWMSCPDFSCFSVFDLPYTKQVSPRDDGVMLPPGCLQYGPYIPLEPGDYIVCVTGTDLAGLDYDVCHASGAVQLPLHFISRNEDFVQYSFQVNESLDDVEMRCANAIEKDALLRGIFLFRAEQTDEISMVEYLLFGEP